MIIKLKILEQIAQEKELDVNLVIFLIGLRDQDVLNRYYELENKYFALEKAKKEENNEI